MAYITEVTTRRVQDTWRYSKQSCLETAASDRIHVQSFLQSELGKYLLFPVRSTFLSGGAFLVWWVKTQTMAGIHSSHMHTMEEVLEEHLSGKLNMLADYESPHLSICSDCKLNPDTFLQLNPQFDLFLMFASHWNKQENRLLSRRQDPWHWRGCSSSLMESKSMHIHFFPYLVASCRKYTENRQDH